MAKTARTGRIPRRVRRQLGVDDLLRGPRREWDFLRLAEAYAARRQREDNASLNEFAVEHGALASALYERVRDRGAVLWHGTSLPRAEKILEHGFMYVKGVWMAVNTSTPLGFARNRSQQSGSRPAILISVIDLDLYHDGVHFHARPGEVRFTDAVPPDVVQYLLTDRDFRYVGEGRASRHQLPATIAFVKRQGRWVVPTQNPAVYDALRDLTYRSAEEWLELKLTDFFEARGRATPIEAFCAVYATCQPAEAVPRAAVVEWLARRCEVSSRGRWGPVLRVVKS